MTSTTQTTLADQADGIEQLLKLSAQANSHRARDVLGRKLGKKPAKK